MIDHLSIKVADLAASKKFYLKALEPLGYGLLMEHEISGLGFGRDGKPNFWLTEGLSSGPIHVAFGCASHSIVDAFYSAAIEGGGTENGASGLRGEYHPTYYGAFVLDPDGNNVEAVCHFEQ